MSDSLTLSDLVDVMREGTTSGRTNEREEMRLALIESVALKGAGIVRIDGGTETFQKDGKRQKDGTQNRKGDIMPPGTVAARYVALIRDNEFENVHVVHSARMAILCDDENYVAAVAALA